MSGKLQAAKDAASMIPTCLALLWLGVYAVPALSGASGWPDFWLGAGIPVIVWALVTSIPRRPRWLRWLSPLAPLLTADASGGRSKASIGSFEDSAKAKHAKAIKRGWPGLAGLSGLEVQTGTKSDGSPIMSCPELLSVENDPLGYVLTLRPLPQVTASTIAAQLESLATTLDVASAEILESSAQRVVILLRDGSSGFDGTREASWGE